MDTAYTREEEEKGGEEEERGRRGESTGTTIE